MTPPDANNVERVRASFSRQHAMTLLGAQMTEVGEGMTEIVLPFEKN